MSEDRSLLNRRRFRIGAIGMLVALTTSAAMPAAAAISVDVTEEICSFQISEHDALAATAAERELQEAVVSTLKQRFPELAEEIDYYHARLSLSTGKHGARAHSGEVEWAEQQINRAGRKAGFAAGELSRVISEAAKSTDSPASEATLLGQTDHMEWHQEQAAAFLTFQPRSNADLVDYWPARSAGASQAMIDLEIEAARGIGFLDHLDSMNTAYRACAQGQSGEFPVSPPPGEPSPATQGDQLTAAEQAALADAPGPAPTILARDGAASAPAPAKPTVDTTRQSAAGTSEYGPQFNSVIALVAAVLVGAAVFFLRGRQKR